MNAPPRIPLATYRLQFNRDFTFDHAAALVPYLQALGISHVYASPYLKARPGSTHGYDIIDHNAINPEIGSPEQFARFCRVLEQHGMGQILDFVPNHMGVAKAENAWWLDVLEWGEASPYSDFFDIDWTAARRSFTGKVLLPVLGDQYGAVLERGELRLSFDPASGFSIDYFDSRFPVRPRDYAAIIRRRLSDASLPKADEGIATALERYAGAFAEFAAAKRSTIRRGAARDRANLLKADLGDLARQDKQILGLLQEAGDLYNGTSGDPHSFVRLHNLIERQHYRIAYWRTAADEINYRRFFEINDLAGIRPENPKVFRAIHGLLERLIADGAVHGIRLDHIDGLFDPAAYCETLQALAVRVAPEGRLPDGADSADRPFYIVVEKILARHERLRTTWPIHGTSGYEFLNLLNGLFVDPAGEGPLGQAYVDFVGRTHNFDEIVYACKRHIVDTALASELAVLANQIDRISEQDWRVRDFTRFRLRDALKEVVACFPVYRTYVTRTELAPEDERDIDWAVSQAAKRWRAPDPEIFDFLREVLLGKRQAPLGIPRRIGVKRFAMHFQQLTGPVMAKAMEDTAFYRYHRLISLNEVGGDPRQFGTSVPAFHRVNEERSKQWPHAMLASATHDTKRGEDARARINVLSELPAAWAERAARWSVLNRSRHAEVDGRRAPSRNDEYLIYQALLGVWPSEWIGRKPEPGAALDDLKERLRTYVVKALREAKLRSSWARPNEALEAVCAAFVGDLVDTSRPNLFLDDFVPFQETVAFFGMLNSLAQTALKLTCPGVPDIYQGCELWDLSLVDPDNRRAVDFSLRQDLFAAPSRDWAELIARWPDGAVKQALLHRLLKLRQDRSTALGDGGYVPLQVLGARADHVIAFMRRHDGGRAIVACGRLFARLWGDAPRAYGGAHWSDTWIVVPDANNGLTERLTGRTLRLDDGRVAVADLFEGLPVAVATDAAVSAG
jgi:(1->4)-alpha-D-glucan 1-alpha-D-glucosylmutase